MDRWILKLLLVVSLITLLLGVYGISSDNVIKDTFSYYANSAGIVLGVMGMIGASVLLMFKRNDK